MCFSGRRVQTGQLQRTERGRKKPASPFPFFASLLQTAHSPLRRASLGRRHAISLSRGIQGHVLGLLSSIHLVCWRVSPNIEKTSRVVTAMCVSLLNAPSVVLACSATERTNCS